MRPVHSVLIVIACVLAVAASTVSAGPTGASITPVDLRCEYRVDPLNIDVPHPRLGWRVKAGDDRARGQRQSAYDVRVATTIDALSRGSADLWASGPVASNACQQIEYAGRPLGMGMECWWTVRARDEQGLWSDWGTPARWSMGPMTPGDWTAEWIGSPAAVGRRLTSTTKPADNTRPDPLLRKTFELTAAPAHAVIHIASVGYHELYVNGDRIGDAVFAPSATDHAVRARYVTYDVTRHLRPGVNAIGLWLGTAWSIFPAYQTADKPAAPVVLAQAAVRLPDGKTLRIVTDASWRTHDSPNTLLGFWDANGFGGEQYDARAEVPGWSTAALDDADWSAAAVFRPGLVVSADPGEPNRPVRRIDPVAVAEPKPGVYRIDMGVNYAGVFEMDLVGRPGDRIELRFSEREDAPMTFGLHSVYVLGASGRGTFRTRFNPMAGRWVTVTGLRERPEPRTIKGWLVRPDYATAGGFECDRPALNQIYAAANWTFENCTLGNQLVDCPHRERRGYGDGFGATRMAFDNYRVDAFYAKWCEDWRDVQRPDGSVPHTAPTIAGGGGPAWSGFCVVLPWQTYCRTGDRRVLIDGFPVMRRWLAFLETQQRGDMLFRTGGGWSFLGDWQWPGFWPERMKVQKTGKFLGDTPEARFFNNCYWVYALRTAAKVADVLGDATSADAYRRRADAVRAAVHATFFDATDASYVNGRQAYLAIALHVDLPPPELRSAVWKRLEREILVTRNGHIGAGIIGGAFLFETLLDARRDDLLHAMISKPDYPGWADMLSDGGGTLHEDWDGRGTRLHDSFLYVGGWFIEGLGGIRPPDGDARHRTLEPWTDQTDGPQRVSAHTDSVYGRTAVNWSRTQGRLTLALTVPPNTDAVLLLHGLRPGSLREVDAAAGGAVWTSRPTTKPTDAAVFLPAGHYAFEAECEPPR